MSGQSVMLSLCVGVSISSYVHVRHGILTLFQAAVKTLKDALHLGGGDFLMQVSSTEHVNNVNLLTRSVFNTQCVLLQL